MRCGALVFGYLPHSGVEGHFLGGFQAVDTGAGPESRGRSLRTPTCRRGHRQYLSSGPLYDFPRYRSTVHEVTQVFAAASREVLALEAELAGPRAQPLLASHVRSLQQLEETRLTTVALLQLMGTPELTGQEDSLQMHQLKMKVIKTMEAISEVLQDLRFDAESAE
uniref:Required for excision 1-B domain containing n=1 Tax=Ovis aries TaxID=9940 RepID=A0AC11AY38_SHEEP